MMRVIVRKTHYRSSGAIALALSCLLSSSTAYCQSRPASASTQQWADPGAIEKAKTQVTNQDQNKNSLPSAALPTTTGPAAELTSASTKQATATRPASISGGEKLNKIVSHPSKHISAHPGNQRLVEASLAKLSGTTQSIETGRKMAVSPGHGPATPKTQAHVVKTIESLTSRRKASHAVHSALSNTKDATATSVTVEFDPIYGYSNMVSVGY